MPKTTLTLPKTKIKLIDVDKTVELSKQIRKSEEEFKKNIYKNLYTLIETAPEENLLHEIKSLYESI